MSQYYAETQTSTLTLFNSSLHEHVLVYVIIGVLLFCSLRFWYNLQQFYTCMLHFHHVKQDPE